MCEGDHLNASVLRTNIMWLYYFCKKKISLQSEFVFLCLSLFYNATVSCLCLCLISFFLSVAREGYSS